MKENELRMLKHFKSLNGKKREYLSTCENIFLKFLCECVANIINGTVPIDVGPLIKFEIELRHLRKKTLSNSVRRKKLSTPDGLKLIKTIYQPIVDYLEQ